LDQIEQKSGVPFWWCSRKSAEFFGLSADFPCFWFFYIFRWINHLKLLFSKILKKSKNFGKCPNFSFFEKKISFKIFYYYNLFFLLCVRERSRTVSNDHERSPHWQTEVFTSVRQRSPKFINVRYSSWTLVNTKKNKLSTAIVVKWFFGRNWEMENWKIKKLEINGN
jgi:hypothetical protein